MHLRIHNPLLQQLVAGIDSGEVDPMQALPLVEAIYQHCAEHLQYLSADPSAKAQIAESKQLVQLAQEVITNFNRKLQAQQRKAMEAVQAEGQPQEGQPQEGQQAGGKKPWQTVAAGEWFGGSDHAGACRGCRLGSVANDLLGPVRRICLRARGELSIIRP